MPRRGPKPVPTSTLVARGSWRAASRGDREWKPKVVEPPVPRYVKGEARKIWKDLAPLLVEEGVLTVVDGIVFGLLCCAIAEFHEAQRLVEKHGALATTEKGATYQHPAVGMRNKAAERASKLAGQFGLSPSSRAGMAINKKLEGENPNQRFFNFGDQAQQ